MDIKDITIEIGQLVTFASIVDEGSITRAAEKLNLSQPAVSAHVKSLESKLGVKLFERSSKGVVLTAPGKALLEDARKTLSAARGFQIQADQIREKRIEFRLGCMSEPNILRLDKFIPTFKSLCEGLHLTICQAISGNVIEGLLARKLDAGFVIGDVRHEDLVCREIAKAPLRIVGPPQWEGKMKGRGMAGIAELPWIATPEKCSFSRIAAEMFSRHNTKPQVVVTADQEVTLRKLVGSGVGLTLLREDVALAAAAEGELVVWEGHVEVSSLNVLYRKGDEFMSHVMKFRQAVVKTWP